MSEGRCKTCRWWGAHDGEDGWRVGQLRVRDPVTYEVVDPQPFEVRLCGSPAIRFYERPAIDGAALLDGSEYMALFVTGEDFGCVAWAPKEET